MSKLVIILVIAAAAVCINAEADPKFPDFDLFAQGFPFFGNGFPKFPSFPVAPLPVADPDTIKNLKGDPNTVVSGSYESHSSNFESVNGVPTKQESKNRVITNDNGDVKDVQY